MRSGRSHHPNLGWRDNGKGGGSGAPGLRSPDRHEDYSTPTTKARGAVPPDRGKGRCTLAPLSSSSTHSHQGLPLARSCRKPSGGIRGRTGSTVHTNHSSPPVLAHRTEEGKYLTADRSRPVDEGREREREKVYTGKDTV